MQREHAATKSSPASLSTMNSIDSLPPMLPDDVIAKTREKYVEAYERLTGNKFAG